MFVWFESEIDSEKTIILTGFVMIQYSVEFANLICHFGSDKVLLDYLEEIIVPAFVDDTLIRKRGRENPTNYFFYETEVSNLAEGGKEKIPVIFGEFVKETSLIRTQIFDDRKGLVENYASMSSSPSSYFLLMLESHQLVYLPKTPYAPSLGELQTTIADFIKRKHDAYIKELYKRSLSP